MAAYEDFSFFQHARSGGTATARAQPRTGERDALRAELERLHFELRELRKARRLRARLNRRGRLTERLRGLVRRLR